MGDTRNHLLDAATEVLLASGAESLTLAGVAEHAGVSKGGLLYHFPNKGALVAGLVDRLVARFDAALRAAGSAPGSASMAYLAETIAPTSLATGTKADRVAAALLAASLVDTESLRPLRRAYSAWQRRLADDGIDPAVATVVRFAVDGWWLARLLDLA
ncbi:MAG TPA: TetR/AcrR family transcriptional regulator, partial [Pseudonocardiaceae bacterium]